MADQSDYVVDLALAGYGLNLGDRVAVDLRVTDTTGIELGRHGPVRHVGTVVHATRSVVILRVWDATGGTRVRIPWDAIAAITDAPDTTTHPALEV